jgi:hypothetical protein
MIEAMTENLDDEIKREIETIRERIRKEAMLELSTESSTVADHSGPKGETEITSSPIKTGTWHFLTSIGTWIAGIFRAPWGWASTLLTNRKSSEPESLTPSTDQSGAKRVTSATKPKRFRFTKKQTILSSGFAVIVTILTLGLINFTFVTVNGGIETTLGSSDNRTVLIVRADDVERSDLVVAVLRRAGAEGSDLLVLGTVFSKNDQTYALYDGEVIWQIPLGNIRGKVLFAKATQTP